MEPEDIPSSAITEAPIGLGVTLITKGQRQSQSNTLLL